MEGVVITIVVVCVFGFFGYCGWLLHPKQKGHLRRLSRDLMPRPERQLEPEQARKSSCQQMHDAA